MVQLNFNASQHEPSAGSGPVLPEGWYNGVITHTETKRAKLKEGQTEAQANVFLACTTRIQETGADVVMRFNLWNDNPEAVRIANGQLSKLLHVIGIFGDVGDSANMHNKPFQVKVICREDKVTKRMSNEFNDYRYSDGREWSKNPGNAPAGIPPNPQTGAPAGYGAPPAQAPAPGGYPPPNGAPGQAPGGYPPPGGAPAPGGYPPPGGQAPAPGGYPPPGGQAPGGFAPAPGYPAPGQAPAPGGYPPPAGAAPGGFPQPGQAPGGYPPPGAPQGPTPGYPPPAGAPQYGAPGGAPAWPGQPPR